MTRLLLLGPLQANPNPLESTVRTPFSSLLRNHCTTTQHTDPAITHHLHITDVPLSPCPQPRPQFRTTPIRNKLILGLVGWGGLGPHHLHHRHVPEGWDPAARSYRPSATWPAIQSGPGAPEWISGSETPCAQHKIISDPRLRYVVCSDDAR